MPLPCSPASMSERGDTSNSNSRSVTESESESDLITPRPGPANPSLRTHANLSTPIVPPFGSWSSDRSHRFYDFTSESEPERPKRGIYHSTEASEAEEDSSRQREVDPVAVDPASSDPASSAALCDSQDKPITPAAPTSGKKDTSDQVETEGHPPEPYAKPSDEDKARKKKSPRSSPRTSPGRRLKSSPKTSPRQSPDPSSRQSAKQVPKKISNPSLLASDQPSSSFEQRRSVTFCPSISGPERSYSSSFMSRHNSFQADRSRDEAESSADENTAIVRRKTGVGTYGGTDAEHSAAHAGYEGAAEEGLERELSPVERRRKSGSSSLRATTGRGSKRSRRGSTGTSSQESEDDEDKEGFWKGLVDKYGSVELENKGSVARDHLALERTFLAWLRTSLSFASIGIAITQLFRLNTSLSNGKTADDSASIMGARALDREKLRQLGKPLGSTFLGVSIVVLLLGFHRYFESQHYVIRGKFPASRGSVMVVSFVAGALIVTSLVVVVAIAPGAFET